MSLELKKGRKVGAGARAAAGGQSNQKMTKAARKGSVKAAPDLASPITSSLKVSIVEIPNIGTYEECLEALKQAEDDTRRAAIMAQVIAHLKNQLSKVKLQLSEFKK